MEDTGLCKDTHTHTLQLQSNTLQFAHSAKMTVKPTDAFTCSGNVCALLTVCRVFKECGANTM